MHLSNIILLPALVFLTQNTLALPAGGNNNNETPSQPASGPATDPIKTKYDDCLTKAQYKDKQSQVFVKEVQEKAGTYVCQSCDEDWQKAGEDMISCVTNENFCTEDANKESAEQYCTILDATKPVCFVESGKVDCKAADSKEVKTGTSDDQDSTKTNTNNDTNPSSSNIDKGNVGGEGKDQKGKNGATSVSFGFLSLLVVLPTLLARV